MYILLNYLVFLAINIKFCMFFHIFYIFVHILSLFGKLSKSFSDSQNLNCRLHPEEAVMNMWALSVPLFGCNKQKTNNPRKKIHREYVCPFLDKGCKCVLRFPLAFVVFAFFLLARAENLYLSTALIMLDQRIEKTNKQR